MTARGESPDVVPLVPGSIAEHTSCLLAKLGQVAFRLADERLSALGLRVRHYSILQALADLGATPQQELGTYLRIDPATMVSSVDDLEDAKFALRRRSPQDRRRYVVELTEGGEQALAEANQVLAELDRAVGDLGNAAVASRPGADEAVPRPGAHRSLRRRPRGLTHTSRKMSSSRSSPEA